MDCENDQPVRFKKGKIKIYNCCWPQNAKKNTYLSDKMRYYKSLQLVIEGKNELYLHVEMIRNRIAFYGQISSHELGEAGQPDLCRFSKQENQGALINGHRKSAMSSRNMLITRGNLEHTTIPRKKQNNQEVDWRKKEGSQKTNKRIPGEHQSPKKETVDVMWTAAGRKKNKKKRKNKVKRESVRRSWRGHIA